MEAVHLKIKRVCPLCAATVTTLAGHMNAVHAGSLGVHELGNKMKKKQICISSKGLKNSLLMTKNYFSRNIGFLEKKNVFAFYRDTLRWGN